MLSRLIAWIWFLQFHMVNEKTDSSKLASDLHIRAGECWCCDCVSYGSITWLSVSICLVNLIQWFRNNRICAFPSFYLLQGVCAFNPSLRLQSHSAYPRALYCRADLTHLRRASPTHRAVGTGICHLRTWNVCVFWIIFEKCNL